MNTLYNTNYIGALGLNPIYETIINTSNDIDNYIITTSNILNLTDINNYNTLNLVDNYTSNYLNNLYNGTRDVNCNSLFPLIHKDNGDTTIRITNANN